MNRARSSDGLYLEPYAASRRYTNRLEAAERSRKARAARAESLSTADQRVENARAVSRQCLQTWVTTIQACGFSREERSGKKDAGVSVSKANRPNMCASSSRGSKLTEARAFRKTPTERAAACSLVSSRSSCTTISLCVTMTVANRTHVVHVKLVSCTTFNGPASMRATSGGLIQRLTDVGRLREQACPASRPRVR